MSIRVQRGSKNQNIESKQETKDSAPAWSDAPKAPPETQPEPATETPSADAVATSRAALAHDPHTAHLRGRLDAALDADADETHGGPQRTSTSGAYAHLESLEMSAPEEGFQTLDDGGHIFSGSDEDDSYTVSQGSDGGLTITNETSGDAFSLTRAEAEAGVRIDLRSGDDSITVKEEVTHDLMIQGGFGDDSINARNAQGQLTLSGGFGDDFLLGGQNMDVLNGGAGNDRLIGGAGNDQLNGQGGNDRLAAGDGHDYLNGGAGEDQLRGGTGSDAIYADADDTHIDAGQKTRRGRLEHDAEVDTIVAEEGSVAVTGAGNDDVTLNYDPEETEAWLDEHPEFVLAGDRDFRERTTADIGVMLGTEQGRGLLNDLATQLQDSGEKYTFREKVEGAGGSHNRKENRISVGNFAGTYSAEGAPRHPLPVLFHELVHTYQTDLSGVPEGMTKMKNGSTVNNIELQATGLPWIDAEGNLHDANELAYTDNLFREELGLPLREGYGGTVSEPDSFEESKDDGHQHAA